MFINEPLTDFTIRNNRLEMSTALNAFEFNFCWSPDKYSLYIDGEYFWKRKYVSIFNPANTKCLIGDVAQATKDDVNLAVTKANRAKSKWSNTSIKYRANILRKIANKIKNKRFELAALEVFEVGKSWVESDADIAEAIDFCNYYADQIETLEVNLNYDISGEINSYGYIARGVAVIIAPWNFPLAILCGMTVAALVTGNCVIIKPAEQSSIIASQFVNILVSVGVPKGVVSFLPGNGSVIGEALVNHENIDLIAFTGSEEVGVKILQNSTKITYNQDRLKKVICELGGKNIVIVDSDADVDEVVPGIIHSAFHFQGQKCSALSRLIVLESCYDNVVSRIVEAAKSLTIGEPRYPDIVIGPLIDRFAKENINRFIEIGKEEGNLLFESKVPDLNGHFVPIVIFDNIKTNSIILQTELFAPFLCIQKTKNLNEAIKMANNNRYALTAGFYSRSPKNIEQVKREIKVGNLYINREITGALVGRHPFGGFKMSGTGNQAGGKDYLKNFVFSQTITENTMRHGFAPKIT